MILVSNNGNLVVNSDAEQLVIAERDASGRISYQCGALENSVIRRRALEVLEGGCWPSRSGSKSIVWEITGRDSHIICR